VPKRGCGKEYAFSPEGPNPRIHTQRLRARTQRLSTDGGSNPPPPVIDAPRFSPDSYGGLGQKLHTHVRLGLYPIEQFVQLRECHCTEFLIDFGEIVGVE